MDRPTCKTCAYWETFEDDDYPDGERVGECQRYPHVEEMRVFGFFRDHEGNQISQLPMTHKIDVSSINKYEFEWCGEHHEFPAYIASLKTEPPTT